MQQCSTFKENFSLGELEADDVNSFSQSIYYWVPKEIWRIVFLYIFRRNYLLNDIQLVEYRKQVFGSELFFPSHFTFSTISLFISKTPTQHKHRKMLLLVGSVCIRCPVLAKANCLKLHRLLTCIHVQSQITTYGRHILRNRFK